MPNVHSPPTANFLFETCIFFNSIRNAGHDGSISIAQGGVGG